MSVQTQDNVKINLLGFDCQQLRDFFTGIGEPAYRGDQVLKWVHQRGVTQFDLMTDLPKALRQQLPEVATIELPEIITEQVSSDGTRKWLLGIPGGSRVEMVFIPESQRGTLCISSQVGCALDCSFCATGKQGFDRNLKASEIIGQLWLATRTFNTIVNPINRVVTNVVFMGMGEPLLNFDQVMSAVNIMLDDNAYGMSKRRVTLSTAGVVPGIDRLAESSDISLAISLHAPNDELRNQLVPINKKYPLKALIAACQNYLQGLSDRRMITIEYTMLAGVNDQAEHATQLVKLLKDLPCKINLIPFNHFPGSHYRKPNEKTIVQFQQQLINAGYLAHVRTTRGDDIAAACGQLAGEVIDKTSRRRRYASTLAIPLVQQPSNEIMVKELS